MSEIKQKMEHAYGCPACGEQHRAGSPGEMCPDLRKAPVRLNAYEGATEKRVREIALEVAREVLNNETTWSKIDPVIQAWCKQAVLERAPSLNQMREIAREEIRAAIQIRTEVRPVPDYNHDEEPEMEDVLHDARIRDSVLEEAACKIMQSDGFGEWFASKAAEKIRGLKSQPAANPKDTVASMVSLAMESTPGARVQPAAQASAEKPHAHGPLLCCCRERDDLRAKLAASDKALDGVAEQMRLDRGPFGETVWSVKNEAGGVGCAQRVIASILISTGRLGGKEQGK